MKKIIENLNKFMYILNNNKFFLGIAMITLNLGSKYFQVFYETFFDDIEHFEKDGEYYVKRVPFDNQRARLSYDGKG